MHLKLYIKKNYGLKCILEKNKVKNCDHLKIVKTSEN